MRPPIVTILGHVDHGKTTLLDSIRNSKVASREEGGITQGIGASRVGGITFIDTPGHAAFSSMREQGAKVADIVVLVVAASEGVMPQTVEALKFINETNSRFIVALTKMDLKNADKAVALKSLSDNGVRLEGAGGDVPLVEVSAINGKGIDELLEMIKLVWEMVGVGKGVDEKLEAVVIETSVQKGGPEVWVVVKNGELVVGSEVSSDGKSCKVRGLFDETGKFVKKVGAGYFGRVLGFKDLPKVGSTVREGGAKFEGIQRSKSNVPVVGEDGLPVVLKAGSAGALSALLASLPEGVVVISEGVGDVVDSDIFLAKSSGANVFAFGSRIGGSVKKLADTEGVVVGVFGVIYNLIKNLEEIIEMGRQKVIGEAQIVDSFPYNSKRVAGCRMVSGYIDMESRLVLKRKGEEVAKVRPVTIKKQKDEVRKVVQGEEFGIIFRPQFDFEIGDVLVSVAD